MAEDNSARLQAMQDAVTDAGNDVRALKVRARSRIFSLSSPASVSYTHLTLPTILLV